MNIEILKITLWMSKINFKIFLTWEKTQFTKKYELEIATDAEMKDKILKKSLKENFYMFRPHQNGTYWWSVRSVSNTISSSMSKPSEFTISADHIK